ncbi:MAG: hypothetical protein ACKOE3_04335, partial [Betaproteobacteria bacterium]
MTPGVEHTAWGRRHTLRWGLALGVAAAAQACAPAWAQTPEGPVQQRQFSGRALHAETGQWLYTEVHQQQLRGGRWVAGTIRYVSPQGVLLGEKRLEFGRDRFVPLMRTVYPALGEEEAITEVGETTVTMETAKAGQRKTRDVARVSGLAVDSGFHVCVQERLA